MTYFPDLPDIPVAEIKHSNGKKETVYQRPDGTSYVEIDILPKIRKPEPRMPLEPSRPLRPPNPFMPNTWGDEMRSLETANMTLQLWAHYNQRENDNLQALTRKWTKEHQ